MNSSTHEEEDLGQYQNQYNSSLKSSRLTSYSLNNESVLANAAALEEPLLRDDSDEEKQGLGTLETEADSARKLNMKARKSSKKMNAAAKTEDTGPVELWQFDVFKAEENPMRQKSNVVKTAKYTCTTFFPCNLLHQLSKMANIYFVIICIL